MAGPARFHGSVKAAPGAVALGVALVVLGLCGTLGIFPLRQWVGRVASNVPAGVAGFILSMSLIAGGAAFARVTVSGFGPGRGDLEVARPGRRGCRSRPASFSSLSETAVSRFIGQLVSAQAAMLLLGLLGVCKRIARIPAFG